MSFPQIQISVFSLQTVPSTYFMYMHGFSLQISTSLLLGSEFLPQIWPLGFFLHKQRPRNFFSVVYVNVFQRHCLLLLKAMFFLRSKTQHIFPVDFLFSIWLSSASLVCRWLLVLRWPLSSRLRFSIQT